MDLKIVGRFIIFFLLLASCDKIYYLTLITKDDRFVKQQVENQEFLVFSNDSLNIKISSVMIGKSPSKKRQGAKLRLEIQLQNQKDIEFNILNTFLVDMKGNKSGANPALGIKNDITDDNVYEKFKSYKMVVEFFHPSSFFNFPLELHFPPIKNIEDENELTFPIIYIQ